MEQITVNCRFCGQELRKDYLEEHLKINHVNLPNFEIVCGITDCDAKFKKLSSLRSHRSRHHHLHLRCTASNNVNEDIEDICMESEYFNNMNEVNMVERESSTLESDDSDMNNEEDLNYSNDDNSTDEEESINNIEDIPNYEISHSSLQKSTLGLMFLSMRAQCQVTEDVVLNVAKSIDAVVKRYMYDNLLKVDKILKDENLCNLSDLIDIDNEVASVDTVHGLDTIYKQNVYFNEQFNVIQPLYKEFSTTFLAAGEQSLNRNRKIKITQDKFVYIPIYDVLLKNLRNETFLKSLLQTSDSDNEVFSSFRDGSRFKKHPIFTLDQKTADIKLYYDEAEFCDGLGTKAGRKQKLGFIYSQYGNRSPIYQASLSSINLVAIVKYPDVKKYGFQLICDTIVEDMKKLETGIKLPNEEIIYGAVSAITGDNQGIHMVCGFKESFSAERPCRHCLVSLQETQIMTSEDEQRLRTPAEHARQLAEIESAITEKDKKELSQAYGINKDCPLNQLVDFDVTTSAPPDVGHDLLLGVVLLQVRNFLYRFCIENTWMSLDTFNQRVADFDYGYSEKSSIPSPIKRDHITGKKKNLKQTASQMWLLAIILPLIVIDCINDQNAHFLENHIQLLEIMAITLSHNISLRSLSYLEFIIPLYLETYANTYKNADGNEGKKFTPKQHFLVHYPRLITIFGPLINFWTLRFEAKHQFFKRIVQAMRNWKNLILTLSKKHQLRQALDWMQSAEDTIETGPKKVFTASSFVFRFLFPEEDRLCQVKWVKFNGIKYIANHCYVAVGFENGLPLFVELKKIVWKDEKPTFVCKNVETVRHNMQLMAYEISATEDFVLYNLDTLVCHNVFHSHQKGDKKYIIVKQLWGDLH